MAKCLEDFRNLFGAGSQPKLCYKPDADGKPVEEDHEISEPATNLLPSIMLYGFLILCVCFGLLTYFSGKYRQKLSDSSRLVRRYIGWVLASLFSNIPSVGDYYGAGSQQKLLFVPDADKKPDVDHEISEAALFRFLLNEESLQQLDAAGAEIPDMLNVLKDIDKNWKITEFETHQSSMDSAKDFKGAFHVFIVFKTTSETDRVYWWSLEKGMDYITLQRSRNKENVKDKLYGDSRTKVKFIVENLKGKGTIQDLFAVLWAQQVIPENYHILKSNCQSFVTCISQQITEIGYEYEGFFNYTPRESGRDKKMLDLINILRGGHGSGLSPLFTLIAMGNTDLNITEGDFGQHRKDDQLFFHVMLNMHGLEMKICGRLLEKGIMELTPSSETDDCTGESDDEATGVNTLRFEDKGANPSIDLTEFDDHDLLIARVNISQQEIDEILKEGQFDINGRDENGDTPLIIAIRAHNVKTVGYLLKSGADPTIRNSKGFTPFHLSVDSDEFSYFINLLLLQSGKGEMR
ncbi:hypothetical protein DAPPUDRAFT_324261 [Daphnia pulex]|uniref:Uncharacterized protein n=1 Tax=Daphnia pulex TaxID=6669 RepID=E9H155_DAPPU|nr:hypothetical protein DAPPUDRAFT_324261 [Daphnia pulex]|eukprot:EFX74585.1 hypothetical protein DAPPUDRAFT_324261 [Daphnia pulex]